MVSKKDIERIIEHAEELPAWREEDQVHLYEIVFRDGTSEVIPSEVEPGHGIKGALERAMTRWDCVVPCFWITSFGDGVRADQVKSWRRLWRGDLDALAEEMGVVAEGD